MEKFNSIVFTTDKYHVDKYDSNSKEKLVQQLWKDVSDFLRLATKQGYVCKVYDDDTNIIVVEYNYGDAEFGGPYLEWLEDDEADLIDNFRNSTDNYQESFKGEEK